MKNLFLIFALVLTSHTFATDYQNKTKVISDCWTETNILCDGSELDIYTCSAKRHYEIHAYFYDIPCGG